jgi:Rieske Fe-S protein
MGGKIFTRSHVEDLVRGDKPAVKVAGGLTVQGNFIVFATNTPVNDWITIHTKQEAYRTYVIGALVPKGSIPSMLLWDTDDPYHYVRLQSLSEEHDVLIIGGEDHKTGQGGHNTEACFDRLESWARGLFPNIEFVEFRWSGQIMEPVDSLAFIGLNPGDDNIFIATGDSGHGMTHGTIAGMLINDLMDGARPDWARLYDPSRKTVKAAGEFARANLNVAKQYFGFLTGGDVKDADRIAPGSGAVLRRGLQKVAAYRDEAGQLHELSAICPHLGCIVDWNDTEKTWDCPCHGSRFSSDGSVVNGPANTGLSPTEDDDDPVETIPAVQ